MALSFTFSHPKTTFLSTTIACMIIMFSSQPHANPIPRRPFDAVYAFGDSSTDTGNRNSNIPYPYGSTFFHPPASRYSDGRLVIDFVADSLSLPFLPPYLDPNSDKSSGINFAVGGATAIIHSFFVENNMTLNTDFESIQTELAWFNKFLESKGCKDSITTPNQCAAVFEDALIWVGEIGSNDYAYSFGTSVSNQTIKRLAIKSVTRFLQAILEKGAKYVVVQDLPPTGCLTVSLFLSSPDDRDDIGCVRSLNDQSFAHNTALLAKIHLFRQKYPKSVIVYADYYNAFREVMKNPTTYGFKELYKVCCGYGGGQYNYDIPDYCGSANSSSCNDPSEYINWDGLHFTEALYRVMADAFVNGTFSDPPFSYLLWKKRQSGLGDGHAKFPELFYDS